MEPVVESNIRPATEKLTETTFDVVVVGGGNCYDQLVMISFHCRKINSVFFRNLFRSLSTSFRLYLSIFIHFFPRFGWINGCFSNVEFR